VLDLVRIMQRILFGRHICIGCFPLSPPPFETRTSGAICQQRDAARVVFSFYGDTRDLQYRRGLERTGEALNAWAAEPD
jgi:hypothetical protein